MTLARRAIFLITLVYLPNQAFAVGVCNDQNMSTVARAACYLKAETKTNQEMMVMYGKVMGAIDTIPADPDIKTYFKAELRGSQESWEHFSKAQCSFEADTIMGSAAAFVGTACALRLDETRTDQLSQMLSDIGP